jgi:ribosomal protein S18 acetylase RimI-like enzyme
MTEPVIIIRPALPGDAAALSELSTTTFVDTYAAYNTAEDMQLYIDTYFTPQRITEEINSSTIQYFIAYINNVPAGYIKMRTGENPPELSGIKNIEVERIYVLPTLKGMKIGKQLINHALLVARQQHYEVLWLGVWQENKNAIAFYNKMGFTIFGEHDFILGTDVQKDWLMKITLSEV